MILYNSEKIGNSTEAGKNSCVSLVSIKEHLPSAGNVQIIKYHKDDIFEFEDLIFC